MGLDSVWQSFNCFCAKCKVDFLWVLELDSVRQFANCLSAKIRLVHCSTGDVTQNGVSLLTARQVVPQKVLQYCVHLVLNLWLLVVALICPSADLCERQHDRCKAIVLAAVATFLALLVAFARRRRWSM